MRGLLGLKSIVLFRVLGTLNLTRVACSSGRQPPWHGWRQTCQPHGEHAQPQRLGWDDGDAIAIVGPGRLRGPHGEADMGHLAGRPDVVCSSWI